MVGWSIAYDARRGRRCRGDCELDNSQREDGCVPYLVSVRAMPARSTWLLVSGPARGGRAAQGRARGWPGPAAPRGAALI